MKDEQLIKDLIRQGESELLEFKESVRKEDIANAICAFLNAEGGIVLVGVRDNGEVAGIEGADKLETELNNYLINTIIPEAPITVSTEAIKDKNIILIKVWSGSKPPYLVNNTIYIRKGGRTAKASSNDISKLILERQKTERHWERQPALGVEMEDLDELTLRDTLRDLEKTGRGKSFPLDQAEEFLRYYGLLQHGSLTNAAVVLFAREPARFLPQSRVRLTVFSGSKASDTFPYDRLLEGNLFRNIDDITNFFEVNIPVSSHFSDRSWKREDVPYPKAALREGLLNALIHRDYANVSGSVLVAFYPDHLEMTNYGELPAELTPADLARNHLSLPRNPDIAQICFLRGWIEKIGRGTLKMIEDCQAKGFPAPVWQSRPGVTTLTFPEVTITAKTGETANEGAIEGVIEGAVEGVTKGVKEKLTTLLTAIAREEGKRVPHYKAVTGFTDSSMERYLRQLREAGLIEFKGAVQTGGYYLTNILRLRLT
jgi:ATP-dependent DNA helicase RecG